MSESQCFGLLSFNCICTCKNVYCLFFFVKKNYIADVVYNFHFCKYTVDMVIVLSCCFSFILMFGSLFHEPTELYWDCLFMWNDTQSVHSFMLHYLYPFVAQMSRNKMSTHTQTQVTIFSVKIKIKTMFKWWHSQQQQQLQQSG